MKLSVRTYILLDVNVRTDTERSEVIVELDDYKAVFRDMARYSALALGLVGFKEPLSVETEVYCTLIRAMQDSICAIEKLQKIENELKEMRK